MATVAGLLKEWLTLPLIQIAWEIALRNYCELLNAKPLSLIVPKEPILALDSIQQSCSRKHHNSSLKYVVFLALP